MYIKNNNLLIRNASADDALTLGKWWRDGNVMAHAGFPNGLDISDSEIEKQLLRDSDETYRRLIVEADNIPIGEMNYRNMGVGTAQIGIKICDSSKQGMGYGTILIKILITQLFEEMDYKKIILDTNLNNLHAQHVYEKIGFQKVAVSHDSWKNQLGELQSSVEYELNRENF